jgi:hypothetical protein
MLYALLDDLRKQYDTTRDAVILGAIKQLEKVLDNEN